MRALLQWIIGVSGLACIGIALVHIIVGPSSIPGSIPVNATLDSEDRFYASIFLGFGAALLGCVRAIESKKLSLRFLLLIFLLGGLARIISIVSVGWPHPFFIAMTGVELGLPLLLLFLLARLPHPDHELFPSPSSAGICENIDFLTGQRGSRSIKP